MKILKEELAETRNKLDEALKKLSQSQSHHEKEHLKTILTRFLDRLLKGATEKDTPELLKILCSLADCNDKERASLVESLQKLIQQSQKKEGLFGKLFK
jgi:hypothetical protein